MDKGSLGGLLQHVVSVPSGDGDEGNSLWVVSDLLNEVGGFLDDFVETLLTPLKKDIGSGSTAIYTKYLTFVVSILLTATISCLTPRVKASKACSRV